MDFLVENDIYVVILICCLVWFGLATMIWKFDKKVSLLEDRLEKIDSPTTTEDNL